MFLCYRAVKRHPRWNLVIRACADGQDFCHWLDRRQSASCQDEVAAVLTKEKLYAVTGEEKSHILDSTFYVGGIRLKRTQFRGIERISQELRQEHVSNLGREIIHRGSVQEKTRFLTNSSTIVSEWGAACERCCNAHMRYLEQEALNSRSTSAARPLPPAAITSSDIRRLESQGNSIQTGHNNPTSWENIPNVSNGEGQGLSWTRLGQRMNSPQPVRCTTKSYRY